MVRNFIVLACMTALFLNCVSTSSDISTSTTNNPEKRIQLRAYFPNTNAFHATKMAIPIKDGDVENRLSIINNDRDIANSGGIPFFKFNDGKAQKYVWKGELFGGLKNDAFEFGTFYPDGNIFNLKSLFLPGDSSNYDLKIKVEPQFDIVKMNIFKNKDGRRCYVLLIGVSLKNVLTAINRNGEKCFTLSIISDAINDSLSWGFGINNPSLYPITMESAVASAISNAINKSKLLAFNLIDKDPSVKEYTQHATEEKQLAAVSNLIWDRYSTRNVQGTSIATTVLPFDQIKIRIQSKVDTFLSPRQTIDISSRIPPETQQPNLPPAPELVKSEFETKAAFYERVQKTQLERQKQIEGIQQQYRTDVEQRNKQIDELKKNYEADITAIKKEQEEKKRNLPKKIAQFTKESFIEVMGAPVLENPTYDAETQTMHATLRAKNADYSKKVSMHITSDKAQLFHENIKDVSPIAIYSISNNEIKLEKIKAYYDGNPFEAKIEDKEYLPEKVQVALKDTKVYTDSLTQNKLTLQNPNLRDSYMVQAMSYGENGSAHGLNYVDDLKPIIENIKAVPEDTKKWLFIIAVENYDQAEPVIFSKNSALEFKEVAQKLFGVSERNTYSLIEEKATSGAIKDKLEYLIRNVKEGDLIYFYYSGHGVPDQISSESYILPKDVVPDFINRETAFSLTNIYKKLTDTKASKIIAFIDACFSGKTDNVSLLTGKGVAPGLLRSKDVQFDNTKMALFCAGKNTQFSNSYNEKGHRMFSYFLIKSLITQSGLTPEVLYKEVNKQVRDNSLAKGDVFLQEPQIYGNIKLGLY